MRTPTAISAGRLARCLSLRSLAGLGRLVALLLGEAAPDAVDLPGPQRERETRGPDRAARRSPSPRPPAPATCPWTRSGRTDRDRRTGRQQAATTCRRQSAAPPRRGTGTAGRLPRHGASGRLRPARTTANSKRACMAGRSAQALSPARVAAQSRAMAKAGRNQHMHGCPRKIGSAVLRSRESP
jgi:hypothetical protein